MNSVTRFWLLRKTMASIIIEESTMTSLRRRLLRADRGLSRRDTWQSRLRERTSRRQRHSLQPLRQRYTRLSLSLVRRLYHLMAMRDWKCSMTIIILEMRAALILISKRQRRSGQILEMICAMGWWNISRTILRMRVNSARHFLSKSIRAVCQTDSSMRLLPFRFIPSRALMWCLFQRIWQQRCFRRNTLVLSRISLSSRESVIRITIFLRKSHMPRERRKRRLRKSWMMSVRMTSAFSSWE